MLRFLSSLFRTPLEQEPGLDEAMLEKAIERVVVGTDQRLRALGHYQRQLREPVQRSILHVSSLVDELPAPTALNAHTYGDDPRLRAFFVSTDHMAEVFGKFRTVGDYLKALEGSPPDEIFGLMTMVWEERNVFGMELEDDMIRKDVIQRVVNFSNHRFLGPTGNEQDTRWELKKRAFDFLIEKALAHLIGERSQRRELDHQRHLLKRKLDAMRAGNWGLGSMTAEPNGEHPDQASLELEIARIEEEFGQFRTDQLGLEETLACIMEVFNKPVDWLSSREVSLRLDSRGVIIPDSAPAPGKLMTLTELISGTGERRIVIFGYIPRQEIPEPPDFWQAAKRYL